MRLRTFDIYSVSLLFKATSNNKSSVKGKQDNSRISMQFISCLGAVYSLCGYQ